MLNRPRLKKKYNLTPHYLHGFFYQLHKHHEPIVPTISLMVCRDSKDDKFLEVAVDGMADVLVTEDNDLLELHPFRDIPIITLREMIANLDAR